MKLKKENIVVIGAGRFGSEIIKRLFHYPRFNTILIEKETEKGEALKEFADEVYIGDTTNEDFLQKLALEDVDIFVIGIGDNIKDSILTASIIKDKYKNKQIIAKVVDARHEEVLHTLGINNTINPQKAAAKSALMNILNPKFSLLSANNIFELSEKFSIIKVDVKKEWIGKTIDNIEVPKSSTVAFILRDKKPIIASGEIIIEEKDKVVLVGKNAKISDVIE